MINITICNIPHSALTEPQLLLLVSSCSLVENKQHIRFLFGSTRQQGRPQSSVLLGVTVCSALLRGSCTKGNKRIREGGENNKQPCWAGMTQSVVTENVRHQLYTILCNKKKHVLTKQPYLCLKNYNKNFKTSKQLRGPKSG